MRPTRDGLVTRDTFVKFMQNEFVLLCGGKTQEFEYIPTY